jgi:hypothetical protein
MLLQSFSRSLDLISLYVAGRTEHGREDRRVKFHAHQDKLS